MKKYISGLLAIDFFTSDTDMKFLIETTTHRTPSVARNTETGEIVRGTTIHETSILGLKVYTKTVAMFVREYRLFSIPIRRCHPRGWEIEPPQAKP